MNIGNLVQNRRKQLGFTQKELADDICTQAMISKIERNLMNPSSLLLKKIADKLEVTTSYFFNEYPQNSSSKADSLINQIQNDLNRTKYQEVYDLMNRNQKFIEFLKQTNQNKYVEYLEWTKANLDYHLLNKKEEAINNLQEILGSEDLSLKTRINSLSLLGIINYEEKQYQVADDYFIQSIELFTEGTSYKLKAKTLYNYALNLIQLDKISEALEVVLQGIELLLSNQSLYMLGYYYYLRGVLFIRINDPSEALDSFNTASTLFKMLDYSKMYGMSRIEIQRIKEMDKSS